MAMSKMGMLLAIGTVLVGAVVVSRPAACSPKLLGEAEMAQVSGSAAPNHDCRLKAECEERGCGVYSVPNQCDLSPTHEKNQAQYETIEGNRFTVLDTVYLCRYCACRPVKDKPGDPQSWYHCEKVQPEQCTDAELVASCTYW